MLPPCKGESCVMRIGAVRRARMTNQGITFISGNLCPTRGESLACKRISTKWRTSATREVPHAAHYIGAAKRWRGDAATVGVTPSVSHMLDSSLMEGAKDTQAHLSVGTQCRAGNFLLKSRKYCVRLRAILCKYF